MIEGFKGNPSNNQEVFDYVVGFLRKQNAKSIDGVKECRYRNDSGLACAAGCIVPDSDYDSAWEGKNLYCSFVGDYFRDRGFDTGLISRLQTVHDVSDIENWEMGFESLAKAKSLIYTAPQLN